MSCAFFSNGDAHSLAHRAGSDGLMFVLQRVLQLNFCYLSTDERLPGGMAVSASSHLISSHLISSQQRERDGPGRPNRKERLRHGDMCTTNTTTGTVVPASDATTGSQELAAQGQMTQKQETPAPRPPRGRGHEFLGRPEPFAEVIPRWKDWSVVCQTYLGETFGPPCASLLAIG